MICLTVLLISLGNCHLFLIIVYRALNCSNDINFLNEFGQFLSLDDLCNTN